MLKNFPDRSFTNFVKFMPRYFYFYFVIINGAFSFIKTSNYLYMTWLLIPIIWFYILLFYWILLLFIIVFFHWFSWVFQESLFYWCWIFAWKTSTTSWPLTQPLTASPHRDRNGLFDWQIWKEKAYEWLRHASQFHSFCVIFQHLPHLLNATCEFSRGLSFAHCSLEQGSFSKLFSKHVIISTPFHLSPLIFHLCLL